MPKSNFLENEILDHVLRNQVYTPPAAIYVGLSTANPGEDGAGLAEPVGNNYSRQSVGFGAAVGGTVSNTAEIPFTASGGNWGTITHFALFDAASGGNMLYYAPLTASRVLNDGSSASFGIGELDVSET